MCFWPSDSGRFASQQHDVGNSLQVMGEELQAQPAAASPAASSTYTAGASSSGLSFVPSSKSPATSLNPVAPKSLWGKKGTFSCKVVYASMQKNGKGIAQFNEVKQTYITLDESTANMPDVTAKARSKFGEDFILVAGNPSQKKILSRDTDNRQNYN